MLADAFSLSEIKEGQLLKGVVSRKKQMIPPIMNVLEKGTKVTVVENIGEWSKLLDNTFVMSEYLK